MWPSAFFLLGPMAVDSKNITMSGVLKGSLLTIVLAALMAELYKNLGGWSPEAWLTAATLNSAFAIIVVVFWQLSKAGNFDLLRLRLLDSINFWWGAGPALVIAAASFVAVGASQLIGMPTSSGVFSGSSLAWVLWIPIIEEIVFRGAFGSFFRTKFGLLTGAWFSALLFALVHGQPTLANILAGKVGVPLGPFLLALICEFLVYKTGRLWPAVAFHAACNSTPIIFGYFDDRWLKRLGMLYL